MVEEWLEATAVTSSLTCSLSHVIQNLNFSISFAKKIYLVSDTGTANRIVTRQGKISGFLKIRLPTSKQSVINGEMLLVSVMKNKNPATNKIHSRHKRKRSNGKKKRKKKRKLKHSGMKQVT